MKNQTGLICNICGKTSAKVLSWTTCPWFGGYICADHCFEEGGCVYLQDGSSNVQCVYQQRKQSNTLK